MARTSYNHVSKNGIGQASTKRGWQCITLVFIFFMKALDTILTDSGFQVPSTDAAEALKTATAVSQWCKKHENFAVLRNFCKYITLQFPEIQKGQDVG